MDFFLMLPALWGWVAVTGTFVFTGLLPALPSLVMMRRGEVKDLFISKREERTLPYLFSFLSYVFWAIFLWKTMQLPRFIVAMAIGSALSIVIMFISIRNGKSALISLQWVDWQELCLEFVSVWELIRFGYLFLFLRCRLW